MGVSKWRVWLDAVGNKRERGSISHNKGEKYSYKCQCKF